MCELDYTPLYAGGQLPAMSLTYPGDWETVVPTGPVLKAHMKALRKRYLRAWGGDWACVWKLEFQRRGAPHVHVAARHTARRVNPTGSGSTSGCPGVGGGRLTGPGSNAVATSWPGPRWKLPGGLRATDTAGSRPALLQAWDAPQRRIVPAPDPRAGGYQPRSSRFCGASGALTAPHPHARRYAGRRPSRPAGSPASLGTCTGPSAADVEDARRTGHQPRIV
ncbi:hypothetical protein HBB16_04100 [Pseudonocardia sp. MCCB 268]|nr:hypothetical protein [Pseudonocardia cytotoxica]